MKVVIIILIGVTILFAILGVFNISKENMDNVDKPEVPQCFPNSVVDHDYASFNEEKQENDERYILKTKIVPPKGTACPTEISDHASKYLNEKANTIEASQSINSSSSSSVSNTSNLTQNISENTPSPSESKSSTPETIENKNLNNLNNSKETNELNNSNISNNTCPPCPACERCPEPAFDCKKVPNYRSPSIGQYLPMPILNDFSKF